MTYANAILEKSDKLANPSPTIASGEMWHLLQTEKTVVTQSILNEALLHDQVKIEHENDPSGEIPREIEWLHRAQLESRLREIGEAQDRLIVGTYGRCVDCSDAIDPRRLAADPAAGRCLSCQSMIDSRLRLH